MSSVIPQAPVHPPRFVASRRHTIVLTGAFLAFAAAGALFQRSTGAPATAPAPATVLPVYLSLLVMEWGLVFFVWWGGLRRAGTTAREVIGGRWRTSRDVLRDVGIAVTLWGVASLVPALWGRLMGADHAASIAGYLPRGPVESLLWVLVSVSAGFCEEFVFRGYFMRQFSAWTGRRAVGLVLQAVLFGVSHGYQGVAACARIALFGVLFGAVALWRGSLRPGMMAHAMTDVLSGIFRV